MGIFSNSVSSFQSTLGPIVPIEYLIIAGGGGGQGYQSPPNGNYCGAGGAGGFISGAYNFVVGYDTPRVQVGAGGLRIYGATVANDPGADGLNSSFVGITAYGGGGGGNADGGGNGGQPGSNGGSGGGGGYGKNRFGVYVTGSGGLGIAGQGNNGGDGVGGGGGAGGPGSSNYGPGLDKEWLDGFRYAGGGDSATPTYISSGSGGSSKFNTTIGTEGYNGLVKVRYTGSVVLFDGGQKFISGGYVYHSFNAGSQPEFNPGTTTEYDFYYTGPQPVNYYTNYWNIRQCETNVTASIGITYQEYTLTPAIGNVITFNVDSGSQYEYCWTVLSAAATGSILDFKSIISDCSQSVCIAPTTTTTTTSTTTTTTTSTTTTTTTTIPPACSTWTLFNTSFTNTYSTQYTTCAGAVLTVQSVAPRQTVNICVKWGNTPVASNFQLTQTNTNVSCT